MPRNAPGRCLRTCRSATARWSRHDRILSASEPCVTRPRAGTLYYGSAFLRNSSRSGRLREIAILRVGHLSNSKYEVFQHEAIGRMVGLSEEELAAIGSGGAAAQRLGPDGAAVMNFVEDLVHNVGASKENLAAVGKHLDQQQILDLILLAGFYMMVCRFLETTGRRDRRYPARLGGGDEGIGPAQNRPGISRQRTVPMYSA